MSLNDSKPRKPVTTVSFRIQRLPGSPTSPFICTRTGPRTGSRQYECELALYADTSAVSLSVCVCVGVCVCVWKQESAELWSSRLSDALGPFKLASGHRVLFSGLHLLQTLWKPEQAVPRWAWSNVHTTSRMLSCDWKLPQICCHPYDLFLARLIRAHYLAEVALRAEASLWL